MVHPIPEDALDSDIAILGRKGGGKTYTSKGIVERLLDMGRRVLVLDPLGVWAGLRTAAEGEHAGYPIAIFGGLHADLHLDPAAAEPLARIIATENLPAVIDLSELSKGKQQAFLLAFLHELRTANHEALTIVLEEADVFAPQNPQGDDSRELHGEVKREAGEAREEEENGGVEDDDRRVEVVDPSAVGVERPETVVLENAGEAHERVDVVRAVPEPGQGEAEAEPGEEVPEEAPARHPGRR